MKGFRSFFRVLVAFGCIAICLFATAASAQSASQLKHRQQQKNTWRNIGIASGAAGLLGLLKGDSTLTFVGASGALYSAYRYEQDRKSQSKMQRARAEMFRRQSFTRDGHRYVRKTTYKHRKKYYYFQRVS